MAADEIVLSYEDSLIRQSDLMLIQNNDWINDSIITFWFEYLSHEMFRDAESRVSFISPEVTQLIKSADSHYSTTESVVTSLLESMSLTEKTLILMPLNDHSSRSMTAGGSHWTLIAIIRNTDHYKRDNFSFFHLDSLHSNSNQYAANQIFRVLQNTISYSPDAVICMDCTPQVNSYDCGIHVMVNADAVCQQVLHGDSRNLSQIAGPQSIRDMRPLLIDLIHDLRSKRAAEG